MQEAPDNSPLGPKLCDGGVGVALPGQCRRGRRRHLLHRLQELAARIGRQIKVR